MEQNTDLKIKILTEKLEKESGRKVILEDVSDDFIKNSGRNRGDSTNEVKNWLDILKQALSPEGWKILETFMKGATGMNRYWKVEVLAKLFSTPGAAIKKSVL